MSSIKRSRSARTMHSLQALQGIEPRQINSNSGALDMTDQEIIDMFDRDLRITLAELGRMSGRSVKDVKKILMKDAYEKDNG